ncbi:MAG: hypothetical protein MUC92_12230, partial [Fimbriimonadaceae bacterium]|nr:hypothetical protein [Fimbriimonadaceae bacterium]
CMSLSKRTLRSTLGCVNDLTQSATTTDYHTASPLGSVPLNYKRFLAVGQMAIFFNVTFLG